MKVERKCKIVSKDWLNRDAVYMVLEVGDMVRTSWKGPGQFVHIKCGDSLLLRRPISVCTCQEDQPEDLLAIVFEVRGEGTQWLANRPAGHSVDVMGLLGNGFTMKPEGRYLLVGGGIGVPPMLGCAQYAPGRCTAILGFRSGDRVMLEEQFRSVCSQVQVATDDGSYGFHGYVDALVRRELAPVGFQLEKPTIEDKIQSLKTDNIHGRCVWDCEHTVVDHQSVAINFADGATATLNMIGGTAKAERNLHIIGTKGEIKGVFDDSEFTVRTIDTASESGWREEVVDLAIGGDKSGMTGSHGGGDLRLVEDFVRVLQGEQPSISCTNINDSLNGHLAVFRAEKSRRTGTVAEMPQL